MASYQPLRHPSMTKEEQKYREFRNLGYDHIKSRDLALLACSTALGEISQ